MNTVILTSVFSAGNHALFAGTRVLYGLSTVSPRRQAPVIFSKTTPAGVPIFALLATSSVSILCFASSFIGSGQLWGWLQRIVGVSNQVSFPFFPSYPFSPLADRMAVHWPRQLAIQKSMDCPEPLRGRIKVLCSLDLALGSLFRRTLHHFQPLTDPQSVVDLHRRGVDHQ